MGQRGQDEDGWDGGDRTRWGTVPSTHWTQSPHQGARQEPVGLGGTGDTVGTPGWGHGPSVGHFSFQQRWLSGDPHPEDPCPGRSGVSPSPAPRWRPQAGCSPRAAPHAPCPQTLTCMQGSRLWDTGQGTQDPRCPRPVTPRCAPDPPAKAHASHALPALRALLPR